MLEVAVFAVGGPSHQGLFAAAPPTRIVPLGSRCARGRSALPGASL